MHSMKKVATLATQSTVLHPYDKNKCKLLIIIPLLLSTFKNGRNIKGTFLPAAFQLLSCYTSGNISRRPPERAQLIPAASSLVDCVSTDAEHKRIT